MISIYCRLCQCDFGRLDSVNSPLTNGTVSLLVVVTLLVSVLSYTISPPTVVGNCTVVVDTVSVGIGLNDIVVYNVLFDLQ